MATLDVMEAEDYWGHAWRQGSRLEQGSARRRSGIT